MHIAQGVFKAMNVNKCTSAGGTFIFWVADWFALMNDKMGGDLDKIKDVGKYLIEVWTAAGMDMENVVFKWASDDICASGAEEAAAAAAAAAAATAAAAEEEKAAAAAGGGGDDGGKKKKKKKSKGGSSSNKPLGYWPQMLDIARRFSIARVEKCCQALGRAEGSLTAAQILYPLMQCCDVFHLKADICQLGVDQRKVNMLARDYCDTIKRKLKPVILSHHMLYGLKEGQAKMSKSDPDSAIFMEDSAEDVRRKILKAYCPSELPAAAGGGGGQEQKAPQATAADGSAAEAMHVGEQDPLKNPCLDYIEHIVLAPPNATFDVPGGKSYGAYADIRADFVDNKTLSEQDLKEGLIASINRLLQPVRDHFSRNDRGQADLLQRVQGYKREKVKATMAAGKATTRLGSSASSASSAGTSASGSSDTEKEKIPVVKPVWARSGRPVWAVFCPRGSLNPSLGAVLSTLRQLRAAPAGHEVVLWVPDWSTRVLNRCAGEVDPSKHADNVDAALKLFLEALKAVDAASAAASGLPGGPTLGAGNPNGPVHIIKQSEAILSDPSGYWISVINVGRLFHLNDVRAVDQGNATAGQVISTMMHVGDVLALDPAVICCSASPGPDGDKERALHALAVKYYGDAQVQDLQPPRVEALAGIDTALQKPPAAGGGGGGGQESPDRDYFMSDDLKSGAGKKMNRAFCAPTDCDFNPPLALAIDVAVELFGGLTVGDKSYTGAGAAAEMRADFAADTLTPQTLKPAMKKVMDGILDAIQTGWKNSGAADDAKRIKKLAAAKAKAAGGGKKKA